MIDFRKAQYLISVPDYRLQKGDPLPELAFFGRSNVGKSTLINLILGQKIAFSSKKAGKTKLLNYFLVDGRFYLVDSPGYGYTAYGSKEDSSFAKMMEGYFENPRLKGAFLLVDSRRGLEEEERDFLSFLEEKGIPCAIFFTKSDKAGQKDRSLRLKEIAALGLPYRFVGLKEGRNEARALVASFL